MGLVGPSHLVLSRSQVNFSTTNDNDFDDIIYGDDDDIVLWGLLAFSSGFISVSASVEDR